MTGLESFDVTLQKTQAWLADLMAILHLKDRHQAYLCLRAVLHPLRDRLAVDEAAHLGAELPMLVRGFYYEGWRPAGKPLKERHKAAFLAHVKEHCPGANLADPERIAKGVFELLDRHVSPGEIKDVKQCLPADLRELWPGEP
jgi:uncharacterized protein (DUF2267 family)